GRHQFEILCRLASEFAVRNSGCPGPRSNTGTARARELPPPNAAESPPLIEPNFHRPVEAEIVLTQSPYSLTLPTLLTVFSGVARIRMTLFPARPSRLNVRNVCARRRRPASARRFLRQPARSRG